MNYTVSSSELKSNQFTRKKKLYSHSINQYFPINKNDELSKSS